MTIPIGSPKEPTPPIRHFAPKGIQASSQEVQKEFLGILENLGDPNHPVPFERRAEALLHFLEKHCPEEAAELRTLIDTHQGGFLKELAEAGGWKNLKATQQGQMAKPVNGCSMEEFRGQTVDAVINLCLGAMKKMGFDPPGQHSATGTPGWNSDIDTVYLAPPGMPEKIQNGEKLLFDAIFYAAFGASSGKLFDTESYLNHAAAAFNTEKWVTSEAGKQGYAQVELNASSLQLLMQHGPIDGADWQSFKVKTISQADPSLKPILSNAFLSVELVEASIQDGIKKQIIQDSGHPIPKDPMDVARLAEEIKAKNPQAEPLATMNFKTGVLLKIAEEMDATKDQIAQIDKYLKENSSAPEKEKQAALEQREQLHLKIGTLALLRNRFFDEGYNSQGAFTKVCFLSEGQMHQRKIEKFQTTLLQSRSTLVPLNVLIAEGKGERFSLAPAQREKSNNQQNMICAVENLAMYKGHFSHAAHTHESPELIDYQKAVVAQSKYSERTLGSAIAVTDSIASKPLNEEEKAKVKELKTQLESTYFTASELEKVKRKTSLNKTTTKHLLMEKLQTGKAPEQIQTLNKQLDLILDRSEMGGSLHALRFEESLLPQDIYLSQMSALAQLGLINIVGMDADGNPLSDDPEINGIMQARCGLNLSSPSVQNAIRQSESITLQNLGLTSEGNISTFNELVENLTMQTYNLAIGKGVIDRPASTPNPNTSMLYLWQKVTLKPENNL